MKKKKILVIVFVLGVLLAILYSLYVVRFTDIVELIQGIWAFISGHWIIGALITVIIFLFGGIGNKIIEWYHHRKEQKAQRKHQKTIKVLRHFINPLIKNLEREIHDIDDSLINGRFGRLKYEIKPNYKFAYTDILGNKDKIIEKVEEYNNPIKSINDTESKFEQVIEKSIKQIFPDDIEILEKWNCMKFLVYSIANNDRTLAKNTNNGYGFWNEHINEFLAIRDSGEPFDRANEIKQYLSEAKRVATELKDKLEELKGQYKKREDVEEDEIEIEEEYEEVVIRP